MRLTRRLLIVLLAVVSGQAGAADAPPDRGAVKAAFELADRGLLAPDKVALYAASPAYPWLQADAVRGRIESVDAKEYASLPSSLTDSLAGAWLREAWLRELVRRQDWSAFHALWPGGNDKQFRCADLLARAGTGEPDANWVADALALWLTGESLPDPCDRVFDRLSRANALTADLRWQRIDLAIAPASAALVRSVAAGLPAADRQLANGYADYLERPVEQLPGHWPRTARTRAVLVAAWTKLAKADPAHSARLLAQLGPRFGIDDSQRGKVLYEVALWSAASYLPDAGARLAAVPAANYDDKLYEWRVREAIGRGDDGNALAALASMPDRLRNDPHWQYFEARLRERRGEKDAAQSLYRQVAANANFYGWLAADRLGRDYRLCPSQPSADPVLKSRVGANAGLSRAIELVALGRPEFAAREWAAAIKGLGDDERRLAVQRALQQGWYDRAVYGMTGGTGDLPQYELRFPLHHADDLRAQARANGLDPAWVAGQARAESSFMPDARSSADARGLLQLLPETGARTAKRLGLAWQGGDSLFDPVTNLTLGTAYLRQMLDRYQGAAYLAIAAYNAGPEVVDRWRQARPGLDPDLFVEAIPYKETRDYVSRVLAFSVVYDWRMSGTAAPLSDRLAGTHMDAPAPRRAFSCPASDSKGT